MEKYVKCLEIAIVAHKDQKRRSGKPFIEHPMAVSSQFYDEMMKSIAILHDVIEDTNLTDDKLLVIGVDKEVVDVVMILTKRQDEPYKDYIMRIIKNEKAILIKIEDLKHNLSDLQKGTMKDKYELALYVLERGLI